MKWNNTFLLFLFIILSGLGLANHAMWLDEVNCWLVARDSNSYAEMLRNNCNSGHPVIWNTLLFILTRFTANIMVMQVLHLIISSSAAYLFLRYAPFTPPFKACILFSYFIFYEYNIISRNYSLSWLLLIIFCVLFMRERRNYFLLVTTLILLVNVHLFSLFTAIPLFIMTMSAYSLENEKSRWPTLLYSLFFSIAILAALVIIIPPQQTLIIRQTAGHYLGYGRISKALSYFARGFYPMPDFTDTHYWNTNFIISHLKLIGLLMTPLLFIIPFFLFYDKPFALVTFYVPNLLILLFIFRLQLLTSLHYKGYLIMLLVISLWLSKDERLNVHYMKTGLWVKRLANLRTYSYIPFIYSILLCQLMAGIYAYCKDISTPLSEGKNVATYIKANSPDSTLVMVEPYYQGPAVAGYLNTKVYYPEKGIYCSYVNWDSVPPISRLLLYEAMSAKLNNTINKHIALVLAYGDDSITIMQHLIETRLSKENYLIKEVKEFTGGTIR
ncbi:MAG TPA: hypothetical protein VNY36_00330, partial [Bacteroidia bacterium]|nr:hypothetical protein [Bacteroidia bacterium]